MCHACAGHLSYYHLSILHMRLEKPQSLEATLLMRSLPTRPCSLQLGLKQFHALALSHMLASAPIQRPGCLGLFTHSSFLFYKRGIWGLGLLQLGYRKLKSNPSKMGGSGAGQMDAFHSALTPGALSLLPPPTEVGGWSSGPPPTFSKHPLRTLLPILPHCTPILFWVPQVLRVQIVRE